jgi:hypothetical protein
VRFKFKKDFTTGQIREAIQFPISLGTVDAEVTCLGSIVLDRCGAELKRVPLVNAFARNGEPEVHLRRAHYTYLRSYASHLGITASPYLSDAFSAEVKANHWEGGLCSAASGDWHRDACEITAKYSRMLSLKEAITALGRTVFPDDAFLNADYFLYAGATFNVKHLNLAIDFRTIRDRLNADFVLRTENVALPLNVPLISNVRLSTRYAFQILRDSMCWRSRSLALITGLHLRGSSNLTFTSFFTHYSVPVEYDIAMGFDYDPFTEEVTVSDVRVANMDFPLIPGNGREVALRAREPIERAINVYLSSAEYRQAVSHNVRSFLKALQSANIGFEPFATN